MGHLGQGECRDGVERSFQRADDDDDDSGDGTAAAAGLIERGL